jgi:uncharacterized protein (TIGR02147 family)
MGVRIYRYLDFKKFLDAWFLSQKEQRNGISYRIFAKKGEISSAGVVSNIVQGRRKLNLQTLPKFIRALELRDGEAKYFEVLVCYNQSSSSREKQMWYEQLFALLPDAEKETIEKQKEYFAKWYHSAIREAIAVIPVKYDYKTLSKFLKPSIGVVEVRKSVELLLSLDLLRRDEHEVLRPSLTYMFSEREAGPEWTLAYQDQLIEMGRQSLWNFDESSRNISNLTFPVSEGGLRKISMMLDRFYRDLHDLFQMDQNEDRIYQLNMQLFPMSGEYKEKAEVEESATPVSGNERNELRKMLIQRLRKDS